MGYYDMRKGTVVGFIRGTCKDGSPWLRLSILRFADEEEIEKGQVGEIAEKHFVPKNCMDALENIRKDDVVKFKYYKDDNGKMRICKVSIVSPAKK